MDNEILTELTQASEGLYSAPVSYCNHTKVLPNVQPCTYSSGSGRRDLAGVQDSGFWLNSEPETHSDAEVEAQTSHE